MDVLASECSGGGGCESGWTLYFEQSQLIETGKRLVSDDQEEEQEQDQEDDEEEEDLSMVSDASSGPPHPHFHEEIDHQQQQSYFNIGGKKIRQRKNKSHQEHQEQPSSNHFLDDTASSPAFNFSKSNFGLVSHEASMDSVLDYSQGFSATHFESPFLQGRSAYQDHHHFLPGNYQFHNNQWL